jgi:hypothetical protein
MPNTLDASFRRDIVFIACGRTRRVSELDTLVTFRGAKPADTPSTCCFSVCSSTPATCNHPKDTILRNHSPQHSHSTFHPSTHPHTRPHTHPHTHPLTHPHTHPHTHTHTHIPSVQHVSRHRHVPLHRTHVAGTNQAEACDHPPPRTHQDSKKVPV